MNRYSIERWNSKDKCLRKVLMHYPGLEKIGYEELMSLCVEYVINSDFRRYKKEIVSVTSGEYNGEMLFVLIPEDETGDFLVSYIGYGSSVLCDMLKRIQESWSKNEIDKAEAVNELMYICKDMVCNLVKPYNAGWRHDPRFDIIEETLNC